MAKKFETILKKSYHRFRKHNTTFRELNSHIGTAEWIIIGIKFDAPLYNCCTNNDLFHCNNRNARIKSGTDFSEHLFLFLSKVGADSRFFRMTALGVLFSRHEQCKCTRNYFTLIFDMWIMQWAVALSHSLEISFYDITCDETLPLDKNNWNIFILVQRRKKCIQ